MPIVTLYHVTRHYGGPEEGGWWYDRHRAISKVFENADIDRCKAQTRLLNDKAKEEKRQPSDKYQGRYSTANPTDHMYMWEDEFGEHDDTDQPRPHYE